MAKRNKKQEDASKNPETDVVVSTKATTQNKAENKTPEVQADTDTAKSEKAGSEPAEGGKNTELDSENKTETIGTEGSGNGGEKLTKDDLLTKGEFLDAMKKSFDILNIPSEPSEKTEQRNRIAADVFEKNNMKSALYFTSDMIPFFEKNDALKHSNKLDDKTIVTVNKE